MTRKTAAAVAGALGLGASLLAPAGVANARVEHCTGESWPGILDVREFSLQYTGGPDWLYIVDVMAATPQADAQKFVDRPGDEAIFRMWGDDPSSDDLIKEFRPEAYWAAPEGLGMRGSTLLSLPERDEDSFPDPDLTDEWYVGIRLTDIRDGSEHKVETCRLNNEF